MSKNLIDIFIGYQLIVSFNDSGTKIRKLIFACIVKWFYNINKTKNKKRLKSCIETQRVNK